ncbi:hypothetical protein BSG1_20580, partial [Bacillus sp. SG-1]
MDFKRAKAKGHKLVSEFAPPTIAKACFVFSKEHSKWFILI